MNLDLIINEINRIYSTEQNVLVGIDGRSGSGKTTISAAIVSEIKNSQILHLDQFDLYQGTQNIQKVINEVIVPFRQSHISQVLILEGIFALSRELLAYYDFTIWIEYPRQQGFERGLKRDLLLSSIDNSAQWQNYWLPLEDKYINDEHPEKAASVIIEGE